MSRSRKKVPIAKYAPEGKIGQIFANRRVRRYKGDISDGNSYRKLYNQYDIHDVIQFESLREYLTYSRRWNLHKTEQERINEYNKWFRRK